LGGGKVNLFNYFNFKNIIFAAHINHIRNMAGINHVGLGAGYDGINQ
jgi:hypothetical protein